MLTSDQYAGHCGLYCIGIISKLDILKMPKGHQTRISGCGAHKMGPKRLRTRGNCNRQAVREQI